MKGILKVLSFFIVLSPLLVVPYIASRAGNWFYLLGIVCYYLGMMLVAFKQKIILMIPAIFCGWFWYIYGFGIHDFVFFLFICMALGAILFQLQSNVKRFVHRTLPESRESLAYEVKLKEMNRKLEEYKQMNPTIKITPEIIDEIRNEVFFTSSSEK